MKTANSSIADILLCVFAFCLLAGFLFPYSIFTLAYPLLFFLWILRAGYNLVFVSQFYSVDKETKTLRESWQPCQKSLPIEDEVFVYKMPGIVKFAVIPLASLPGLCGIFALVTYFDNKESIAAVVGIFMILLGLLLMMICFLPLGDKIVASKDKLKFDTRLNKVDISWGEILSMKEISTAGTETCRIYTVKKVFNFSDRFEGYNRLKKLICTALERSE